MPTLSSVFTADAALTNLALQINQRNEFFSAEVAPFLRVDKPDQKIYAIDPAYDAERDEDDLRAPGAPARTDSYTITKPISYSIDDHARQFVIPVETEAAMDQILRGAFDPVSRLAYRISLRKDINTVNELNTLTALTNPATKWDAQGAKPLSDLRSWIETVSGFGVVPNTITMSYKAFKAVVTSAEFISESSNLGSNSSDRSAFDARRQQLAELLDMPAGSKIISPRINFKNTARKGQTAALGGILGDSVYLTYTEPVTNGVTSYAGTILTPTWDDSRLRGPNASTMNGFIVETKYDDDRIANMARVRMYYDVKICNPNTGRRVASVLT